LSIVSRALAPKPNIGAQMRGITQTTREPASSRKIIYGRMRVGGQVVFISHSGDDNKYLHMAIAFATHEIQAYDEIWFNDNKIWTASGGFQGDWGTYVTIDRKFGTAGQAASTQLTNANVRWTSDHKLSGIAYIAFRLEWDADKFPQGVPNITAVIRGKKVYDPRDQSIGYSQNPALCLRDYMLDQSYGLGEVAANINDQSVIDAADLCDEQVSLDAGGAQDRYQCNGVIDTANQIKANIEQLLSSMGGRLTYSGGEYFVDGAEYKTPTLTFSESDIVSDIQTQTKQSRRGIYNGVKGIFVSEEKNFKVLDYPAQISSTYETEDGDPIYLDMPLPCVTNNTQAQRLAKIALLKSRQQVVMTMTTNLKGLRVKVGDTIQVTNDRLNYSSKIFEVIDYSLAITDGALGVNLSCIETSSALYDWTTSDEEDFLSGGELPLYDGRTVDNVTGLTFTEIGFRGPDGGVISAVELSWTTPTDAFVELYKIRYNKTGTTDYFYASSREPRVYVSGLDITSNYDFRVKAENLIGVSSSGTTLSNQVLNGDTTAPAVPTSTSATGGIQTITAEWSNPSDLDFKHVEVYVASTDSIPATPTSLVDGEEYVVTGLSGVETRYFWLKAVDFSGNKSAATVSFNASSLTASSSDIGTGAVGSGNIADNAVGEDQLTDAIADIIDDAASRTEILNVQVESGEVLDLETGQDVLIQNLGDVAIFVNESNTTLNTSISTVQTSLSNLENTVVDLTSGTSDIFVQASPPVAGVGGIPDPIPDFSRWYDSDDNNEPYYWDGTQWVGLADPRIASNAASIVTLQSGLNTANSNISANSTAITALDTTTVSQGSSITSLTSDVTTLQTDVTNAESDITTNATAITNLTTRVTDNEGDITSISSDVTTLQTDVTAAEGNITTNATAISGLTTRVTTAEGNITTNSTDITALESTVNDATTGVDATATALTALTTRVTTAEGSITTNSTDITALETTVNDASTGVAANANAVSSLDTRLTTAEGDISTLSASNITDLEVAVADLTKIQDESDDTITTEDGNDLLLNMPTDVASASSTARDALEVRIDTNADELTSQASDITQLRTDLTTAEGDITGNANALTALTTRVTTAEGNITSSASDITALQSDLTDAEGDITTNASAITALTTRVTTAEGTITSQSSDITTLQSDLTDAEGDITTNASAITNLDTRVTTAEGTITSQSTDITTLQSDLTDAEGDIVTNATAITSLTTRVTTAEGTITSQSSDITALENTVNNPTTGVAANATAITGLDTRVTSAEGTITSQASDITTLQSDLTDAEGDITTNATALTALTTRVTTAEGDITSNATSITAINSTINDPTTGLAATATVASGASTTASANSTAITDLEAEAFLTVSAGGNVSGFKATADATGSSFTIQADQFAIVSDDESQTKTPFAVNSVTGIVSFNADVEIDGDLIATGSIQGGSIGNGEVDTVQVASNAITLSQNEKFTNTTAATSSTYVTHFQSSFFNIDDYTDPIFVKYSTFLFPRASGGGLMTNAYARANVRTQLLGYDSSNTLRQTLTVTTSNIYSGAATTNGIAFLRRFTFSNSSVVKVKARLQFNKAGGTSDETALFTGDVEFNVLKR
jgi:predicted  nucleic acid-binding Zn-ribbon protein